MKESFGVMARKTFKEVEAIFEAEAASERAPSKSAGPVGSLCCDALVRQHIAKDLMDVAMRMRNRNAPLHIPHDHTDAELVERAARLFLSNVKVSETTRAAE